MSGDTYLQPPDGWVCFHCGERFTTPGTAAMHFGARPERTPGCLLQRVPPGDGGRGPQVARYGLHLLAHDAARCAARRVAGVAA